MNINDLAAKINEAAFFVNASEKLAVPLLANKAKRAAEIYPEDVTIVSFSGILDNMARNQTFITKAEFSDIYNKLYTRNTKFAEVFKEELIVNSPNALKFAVHDENEGKPLNYGEDSILANALSEAFEQNGQYKLYSNDIALKAEKSCMSELNSIGADPKKVSVFAGNPNFIVCQATYDTPKGESNVLIPIEIAEDKAMLPSMFVGKDGFQDLSREAMEEHLLSTAGHSYYVDGEQLLDILSTAKFGSKDIISDVDRAVLQLNSSKESYAGDQNAVLYQQVDEVPATVDVDTGFSDTFEKKLAGVRGAAKFLFGDKVVDSARDFIYRKLASWGYRSAQVAVGDVSESNLIYSVSLGSTGFHVPIEVKNGTVQEPGLIVSSGNLFDFSKSGVDSVLQSEKADVRALAAASPCHDLTDKQLLKQVKEAMEERNFAKAEDALAVLADREDQTAYLAAFASYMGSLGLKNELVKNASKLEQKIETPLLMGHTLFY